VFGVSVGAVPSIGAAGTVGAAKVLLVIAPITAVPDLSKDAPFFIAIHRETDIGATCIPVKPVASCSWLKAEAPAAIAVFL